MRAVGIILAGGNNNRMKELTHKRAVAAMPIAGSYRSIDFALSNMTNSHIQKVAVLTQYNARSLNEHLYKHFQCNYSKAPYNKWVLDYLELLIKETYNIFDLASYNVSCMNIAFDLLGFKPEEKYSSKMGIDSTDRNGKLIELCIKSNCTNYVCGSGGKTYIDEDVFKQAGINIIYYDYSKIIQGDTYGLKDYRNNSFLDFIAYNGPDALYNLIIEEKKEQIKQYM